MWLSYDYYHYPTWCQKWCQSESPSSMASLLLEGPKQFDFSLPYDWLKWIHQFERFREASGLSSQPEERQINTMIYSMGDKADDILTSKWCWLQEVQYSQREIQLTFHKETQHHLRMCEALTRDIREKERQLTVLLQIYIAWRNTVCTEIFTMNWYTTD